MSMTEIAARADDRAPGRGVSWPLPIAGGSALLCLLTLPAGCSESSNEASDAEAAMTDDGDATDGDTTGDMDPLCEPADDDSFEGFASLTAPDASGNGPFVSAFAYREASGAVFVDLATYERMPCSQLPAEDRIPGIPWLEVGMRLPLSSDAAQRVSFGYTIFDGSVTQGSGWDNPSVDAEYQQSLTASAECAADPINVDVAMDGRIQGEFLFDLNEAVGTEFEVRFRAEGAFNLTLCEPVE